MCDDVGTHLPTHITIIRKLFGTSVLVRVTSAIKY